MMVLPLRPSKFYGSSLPRPRVYNDLKFNSERVDPPLGVMAPLLSWAKDAPWSMGGLSHGKKRMAGKIEGSLKKLRDEDEEDTVKKISESEKEKEGKSPAKASFESETPMRAGSTPLPYKSPAESQLIKQKWASEDSLEDEDCPTVVPESIEKSEKKRSPQVRRRIRRLGEAFNEQALAASADPGFESPKVRSVTRSASKRHVDKESEVFDYVAVPDKVMKSASPRRNVKKKGESVESPVRRSARTVAVASQRFAA
ncbi:hypothetical protein SUGI_0315510 [Cryptomeria japonica]|uniref:uncharacterized protein LOC131070031 n=1 Tax=Cryptomeria japonica TaxID=3369 RepID=UPI002408E234|nr:uncharacterized protein LOC131070031 [Cryptomeria japonica]GLJ17956.1 hypothetical protein SUGI_0315510 [Cryptomeria japonica]